jgi:uncharacterized protein with NRDE domain
MCLILFAYRAHADFPLVIAANRDEAYERPTAAAAFWTDHPHVYGGRDLEMGGAWLALTTKGRVAAMTNFRDGYPKGTAPRSRGDISGAYLTGDEAAQPYLESVAARASDYAGFCALVGDLNSMWFLSNRGNDVTRVEPGVHGLSNHLLDTPWPKVAQGMQALESYLKDDPATLTEQLYTMLADRSPVPPDALPVTGMSVQREKQLASKFIAVDDRYGTRASTVVVVHRNGSVCYSERSFGAHGKFLGEVTQHFRLVA